MRKKQRHNVKKMGLLLVFILAVFLLVSERNRFLKANETRVEEQTEEWITLGWILEDMPPFQKKTERPGIFDGLYTYLFPSLSFSLCFDENSADFQKNALNMEEMLVNENESFVFFQKGHKNAEEKSRWNWTEYVYSVECESNIEDTFANEDIKEEVSEVSISTSVGIKNREKKNIYLETDFQSEEEVLNHFYIVDPTTSVKESQVDITKLLSKDMTLDFSVEGPQILIYHTHSQEAFADSVLGDPDTSIVGAGEYLKALLEEYGFRVIHETGEYDVESRSTAYSNIQPVLENYLAEYPGIQVMIDLHRDEVKEGKLITEIDGKQMAKFMFFNGLSYLNGVGDITYLNNPNMEDNMAFAFQLQYLANQYFPGVTRKIYLKGYRYNLHYRPKSLLVELGAQTNTFEEIINACEPLAEVIARVLYGEK